MSRVYFIKPVGMDGPIKIGCSKMPEKRLMALAALSPFPLELICWTTGYHEDERCLHGRFSASNTHREWFTATPELLDVIAKVKLGASIEEALDGWKLGYKQPARRRGSPKPVPAERLIWRRYGRRLRETSKQYAHLYWSDEIDFIMRDWRSADAIHPFKLETLDSALADPPRYMVPKTKKHWYRKYMHGPLLPEAHA